MDENTKQIIKYLLKESYNYGFSRLYPLQSIADKLNLKVEDIYNENTGEGLLREYSDDFGNGFIEIKNGMAGPNFDVKDLLENWTN